MIEELSIIKLLSLTGIRSVNFDEIRAWLNQFTTDEEKLLGTLIIRYMIYRNEDQMLSLLKAALKKLALEYMEEDDEPFLKWLHILNRRDKGLKFTFGPPVDRQFTLPGKSGEVMMRSIRSLGVTKNFDYPECASMLGDSDVYVLVDDAILTSNQITDLFNKFPALKELQNCAVVVGVIHEDGLRDLRQNFPNLKIFYGEIISSKQSLPELANIWIEKEWWQYPVHPVDVYLDVCKKCTFDRPYFLGHNNQALLLMYHHSVPDNSIQLLWDESPNWQPLKRR